MLFIKIDKYGIVKNIIKQDITFLENIKNISYLYSWIYKEYEYKLFGSDIGNAGSENKYDLPPPIDNNLYFYNLYFIKIKDGIYYDLTIDDYNNFYNVQFEGFEDILDYDDEITEELSEHTSDRDFIDDSDLEIISEEYEEEEAESSNSLELNISDISITDTEEDIKISDNTANSSFENNDLISSIEISISSSDNEDENCNNIKNNI